MRQARRPRTLAESSGTPSWSRSLSHVAMTPDLIVQRSSQNPSPSASSTRTPVKPARSLRSEEERALLAAACFQALSARSTRERPPSSMKSARYRDGSFGRVSSARTAARGSLPDFARYVSAAFSFLSGRDSSSAARRSRGRLSGSSRRASLTAERAAESFPVAARARERPRGNMLVPREPRDPVHENGLLLRQRQPRLRGPRGRLLRVQGCQEREGLRILGPLPGQAAQDGLGLGEHAGPHEDVREGERGHVRVRPLPFCGGDCPAQVVPHLAAAGLVVAGQRGAQVKGLGVAGCERKGRVDQACRGLGVPRGEGCPGLAQVRVGLQPGRGIALGVCEPAGEKSRQEEDRRTGRRRKRRRKAS